LKVILSFQNKVDQMQKVNLQEISQEEVV
jgi:hypothetical protein